MKPSHTTGPQKNARPYFRASTHEHTRLLHMHSLADFTRLLDLYHAKAIFFLEGSEPTNPDKGTAADALFAIPYEGGLIVQPTQGFRTLEDYQQARTAGFELAADYYPATAEGYRQYADWHLAREAGIGEANTTEALRKAGFVEGYQTYQSWLSGERPEGAADVGPANHSYALYQAAIDRGYADWAALEHSLRHGFTQAGDQAAANARGFETSAEYEDATRLGFSTHADYDFAIRHHLRDAADAMTYSAMTSMSGPADMPHDQKLLLATLSRLDQGKRASANRLWEHLSATLEGYRYPDTGEQPRWLTTSLPDRAALSTFLNKSSDALAFGHYDTDGEFFESKRLQDREVVIDGSNVAHNSAGNRDSKPLAANMLLMVRHLRAQGFERIDIIADASLSHRLPDAELLATLRNEATYIESPAERPADVFIIQQVRSRNCLLVSNDTFREWKVMEPWVAEHIDYYRLTFLIKDEMVLMPDLAKT